MKKDNKIKEKKYFDVRMDVILPATIVYRVYAEDAEQALNEIKNNTPPSSVKYEMPKRKIKKATVCDSGCSTIKYAKTWS